MTCQAIVWS